MDQIKRSLLERTISRGGNPATDPAVHPFIYLPKENKPVMSAEFYESQDRREYSLARLLGSMFDAANMLVYFDPDLFEIKTIPLKDLSFLLPGYVSQSFIYINFGMRYKTLKNGEKYSARLLDHYSTNVLNSNSAIEKLPVKVLTVNPMALAGANLDFYDSKVLSYYPYGNKTVPEGSSKLLKKALQESVIESICDLIGVEHYDMQDKIRSNPVRIKEILLELAEYNFAPASIKTLFGEEDEHTKIPGGEEWHYNVIKGEFRIKIASALEMIKTKLGEMPLSDPDNPLN